MVATRNWANSGDRARDDRVEFLSYRVKNIGRVGNSARGIKDTHG